MMTALASTKDVSKAINAFIQSPVLPLPDDLNHVLAAYLEKHEKHDEAGADRLQEELTSIYHKHVIGRPNKIAPFLAVLRQVRPALRSPVRIVQWWDRFIDPVLDNLNKEKGLANEALKNILQLLVYDEDGYVKPQPDGPNTFADRLLSRWMQLNALNQAATGSGTTNSKERFMEEAIMTFGKKDAKSFLTALNNYFIRKEYRNRCLNLLSDFIQSQPPHLHLVLQTPLFDSILKSLQYDDSTTTVSMSLANLFMLLPHMPSSLVPYLPTLFNIYARLLFWDRERSFAAQHSQWGNETKGTDPSWDKIPFDHDLDGNTIHHFKTYFSILYGLYPLNFLDYIRKPQRYLRHANNTDDIDVQASEIRERSERFRRIHLLHPNLYELTIESEKTDFSRWMKSEASEVITECVNLCTEPDTNVGVEPEEEITSLPGIASPPDESNSGLGIPILSSSSIIGSAPDLKTSDPRHTSIASSSTNEAGSTHLGPDLARKVSQSSHPSTRASLEAMSRPRQSEDSPTLPAHHTVTSPSHSHLQEIANTSKARSSLHQSLDNASVPSLALSNADSSMQYLQLQGNNNTTSLTVADLHTQIAVLQRQNLLLQNDLNFERYMKQQHMTHIGELRRKMLREAATEAETQNLIMANRSLKHQLSETKKAESRIKKESENRRNMATKWEAQLSAKLKNLKEEQKRWTAEEGRLRRELEEARGECEKLRKLVADAETQQVRAQQDGEAFEVRGEEIRRLKEEVARLAASERRYQGLEAQMKGAMEEAAGAEARAEEKLMEATAREEQLKSEREGYEREIERLRQMITELEAKQREQVAHGKEAKAVVDDAFRTALENLQVKHAELQRQFAMLKRKYTVAQSSLLDLQVEAQEKKNRAERETQQSAAREEKDVEGVLTPVMRTSSSSPVAIRTRGHRGLSDPEPSFEATSYNATAPLEPVGSGSHGDRRPSTPTRPGPSDGTASPHGDRYHGRGGVQNSLRKEQRKSEGKKDDKKKPGNVIRNFRNLV
ncbi:Hamartin protein-domain-containing protein [Coniochaeta sp. 2T2.1]|nr:Hamartin protein-domain-containing protein [Coniochaeta sp. 2T2.1]